MRIGHLSTNSIAGNSLIERGLSKKRKVAGVAGLEPVTSAVTGQRSNQLSYTPEGEGEVR